MSSNIPDTIDDAQVLLAVDLDQRFKPTGATRHFVNGSLMEVPKKLAICIYTEAPDDYYLFYCNDQWKVMNDTCHESLARAIDQAEFEFVGIANVWKDV